VTADDARAIALALPGAVEKDHHGRPSFRVGGKIFATLWSPGELNIMVGEPGILSAVQERPEFCSEVFWGKRLAAVRVQLEDADRTFVEELLAEAWDGKGGRA
jgi:hypothetical protein